MQIMHLSQIRENNSEWSSSISYVNKPKPARFLFSDGSVWFKKSRFGFDFGLVNRRALRKLLVIIDPVQQNLNVFECFF